MATHVPLKMCPDECLPFRFEPEMARHPRVLVQGVWPFHHIPLLRSSHSTFNNVFQKIVQWYAFYWRAYESFVDLKTNSKQNIFATAENNTGVLFLVFLQQICARNFSCLQPFLPCAVSFDFFDTS